jgi:hypothetical protein
MGKVFFPAFANWWPEARDELLAFPNSSHDDFVDFMAWIGKGLSLQVGPGAGKASKPKPMTGSIQWILQSSDRIRNKNPDQATPKRYLQ